MAPGKEKAPLMQVVAEEPSFIDSPSPASTPLSPQGGTPDNSSDTQDAAEERKDSPTKGRCWRLKRARDLCRNRLVQMALCLIVGIGLGVIFYHVIVPEEDPYMIFVSCPPESPSCPNKWMRSDGKCYFISRDTNDWKSSLEFCRLEGGTLLTTDDETQKDIKTLYDLNGDHWVGLKKEKGEWRQMDGSAWTEPIKFDDPLRTCCLLDSGKYVAQDCSARRRWICVKSLRGDQ